ncbi:MAG: asparaginase, partial [Gemmatimonadetes bacterium]|nr:asparaginase [Gemmatimonadota bacterium]
MADRLPRILLLAAGGTISMKHDPAAGGAIPRLTGQEIIDAVPGIDRLAELQVREFGRFPGPHMTIERMWELRAEILRAVAGGADGVVVTHGTDTIEETAYLLDRSLPAEVP